jgi:geranylgeranyl reductase family protein
VPDALTVDVAVVGAGPGGSAAAHNLAAFGARVALIERGPLPRYKSCAGGIPLRTIRLLPFPIDPVVEDLVSGICVSYDGRPAFTRWSRGPFAAMVMRDRFDALLAERAQAVGAVLLTDAPVRTLERERDGFTLSAGRHRVKARYVVGADGANSFVARATGLGAGMRETAALEAEVRAPAWQCERWQGMINVDFGYRPWGYGWVFPKAERLSVGLVLPPGGSRDLRPKLRRYLHALGLDDAPIERLVGHKLRLRRGREPIAGAGVALVGDAAGLVDEFTEEGIYYAIASGRLAARTIAGALGSGMVTLLDYQRAVDREIQPELRAARAIAEMFYGTLRNFPRLMLGLGEHVGYFWNAFFRVQQGVSGYDDELHRAWWIRPLVPVVLRAARNG